MFRKKASKHHPKSCVKRGCIFAVSYIVYRIQIDSGMPVTLGCHLRLSQWLLFPGSQELSSTIQPPTPPTQVAYEMDMCTGVHLHIKQRNSETRSATGLKPRHIKFAGIGSLAALVSHGDMLILLRLIAFLVSQHMSESRKVWLKQSLASRLDPEVFP